MAFIEFAFFIVEIFTIMLLVYGRNPPYSEVKKLQDRFTSGSNNSEFKTANQDSPEENSVEEMALEASIQEKSLDPEALS